MLSPDDGQSARRVARTSDGSTWSCRSAFRVVRVHTDQHQRVLKASNWVRRTARDHTRDYPGRVGDCRRFLEVNPPDPETQSTANLRSAAMDQD